MKNTAIQAGMVTIKEQFKPEVHDRISNLAWGDVKPLANKAKEKVPTMPWLNMHQQLLKTAIPDEFNPNDWFLPPLIYLMKLTYQDQFQAAVCIRNENSFTAGSTAASCSAPVPRT